MLTSALLAAVAPGVALAQASAGQPAAPWIWAAPGLYGLDGICDTSGSAPPNGASATVDPLFCPQLDQAQRAIVGQAFASAMAQAFPQVEARFGSHLPAETDSKARLRSTLVASLRLMRATYTTIQKPTALDAYLPITLTLDITNVATGEVVFTRTRSDVARGTYGTDTLITELSRQFPARLQATMNALVSEAGAAFRPYEQAATVIGDVSLGKESKAWVVNRGRATGLRTGDGLGADGRILHAGSDYAVVQPLLGEYHTGEVLSRTALAPAEMLSRPSVFTVVEGLPDGYAAPYLGQIFEDALGAEGGWAPVPVNPAFVSLRVLALDEANSTMPLETRSLPDYIASLRVVLLDPTSFPSNVPGISIDHYEAHAFLMLTDATGRVVGAWHGFNAIDDKISADIRFPADQRRDAVLRNALHDAAVKMAGFKSMPQLLPITAQDGQLTIADPGGALPLGATLPVLREVGRFKGLSGPVRIPAGDVTTQEARAGVVFAADAGVVAYSPHGGDVVALEAAGVPVTTRRAVSQCMGPDGPMIEDRGSTPVAFWPTGAENLLAQRIAAPLRLATLPQQLAGYANHFSGWDHLGAAKDKPVDTCFVPVVAVQQAAAGAGYDVTVGYRLDREGVKVDSSGLKVTLTPTALPTGAEPQAVAAMLQADLAAKIPALAVSAAAALKPAS